jgi:hypothetical protein
LNDEVTVRYFGPEQVKVTRLVRAEDGQVGREPASETTVNRWSVEKSTFVREREELARVVRNPAVDPAQALRKHASLAGTYSELAAAQQVAAKQFPESVEDQQRFVSTTRQTLANEIDRGRPMPAYRQPPRDVTRESRELVQERTI